MQTKTEEEKPDFVKVILELRSDSSLDPETKLIQMLNRLTKMDTQMKFRYQSFSWTLTETFLV